MNYLPIEKTREIIKRAQDYTGPLKSFQSAMGDGKGFAYVMERTGSPENSIPQYSGLMSESEARAARIRHILERAGRDAGGIGNLNPEALGSNHSAILRTLQRLAGNDVPRPKWKWSEESRRKAADRMKARHAKLKAVEEAEREAALAKLPPLTPEAAADSATAFTTARQRIAARFPSLPAASLEWLARFAASPL